MKLLILTFLLSFNAFASDDICKPDLSSPSGLDFNQPIKDSLSIICKDGVDKIDLVLRDSIEELNNFLKGCREKFTCKDVKQKFLRDVILQTQIHSRLKPIFQQIKENPSIKRFIRDSKRPSEILEFTMSQYKRSMEDNRERYRKTVLEKTDELRAKGRELESIESQYDQCIQSASKCSKEKTDELKTQQSQLEADLESLTVQLRELEQRYLDPEKTADDIQEIVEQFHDEMIKKLQEKVATDPVCKSLRKFSIDECLEVSEEFRTFVQDNEVEYIEYSQEYKIFDEELQDALTEKTLLSLMLAKTIESVEKKLSLSGKSQYLLDQLSQKMDESLLGQYIDQKMASSACLVQDEQFSCRTMSEPGISGIEHLMNRLNQGAKAIRFQSQKDD